MHHLKKCFLLVFLPLLAFTTVHKFYVSVTNVGYSEKEDALQITSRVFIDDMDAVMKERYDIYTELDTERESPLAEEYLEKYLRTKFVVEVNGEPRTYDYIGKKYDNDVVIFYLEIPQLKYPEVSSIQIQNEMLTDLFDDQQNIVHFKIDGKKKSFVLMKENTKGVLNL
ncbi:DUF6702 family protein [Maribacter sp. 2307UL18-2]|uniref:DUF6702 family protein n=1 Tax=Maribacter sp. 2307UL18-2 TaxID=3386274 RepID=UPI0039BC5FB4